MATGGGAYKYYEKMKEVLGVKVLREDEMECLIIGNFSTTELAISRKLSVLTSLYRSRFLYHRDSFRGLLLQ